MGEALTRSWPAVPASVAEARAAVAGFAARAGADESELGAVKLAVSEAVSNVVIHAYVDRDGPGPIHVSVAREPDGVQVAVADEGRGMIPRTDSPGSGLGLPLIAQMTHGFQLDRAESGGTTLRMQFKLQALAGPAG